MPLLFGAQSSMHQATANTTTVTATSPSSSSSTKVINSPSSRSSLVKNDRKLVNSDPRPGGGGGGGGGVTFNLNDSESTTETTPNEHCPIIMKLNNGTNNCNPNNSNSMNNSLFFRVNNSNNYGNNFSTISNANNTRCSINIPPPPPSQQQQQQLFQQSNRNFLLPSNSKTSGNSAYLKTKRSGSITTLLPLKETSNSNNNNNNNTNNNNNNSLSSLNATPSSNTTTNNTNMNRNKSKSNTTILKRRKSNSLSIIDYCNIINMNTNYQMLANFYDDTEESMARLSLKTNKSANIQKQASLSEQMAALFGSSMCSCYLCKLKSQVDNNQANNGPNNMSNIVTINSINANLNNLNATTNAGVNTNVNVNSNVVGSNGVNVAAGPAATPAAGTKKFQQHNFEITPNKSNGEFSVMKYTYSTPFSQLSTLKLFNLINTDCSINFNNNNTENAQSHQQNKTSNNENTGHASTHTSNYPLLPSINGTNNPNNNSNNSSNSTSSTQASPSVSTLPGYLQINNNSPPIYDPKYMYLIDCRLSRKKFEKSRIHTAIHYSDLLNDAVYLSPPLDNYTLIVLYDDDGTYLTSSTPVYNNNNISSPADCASHANINSTLFKSNRDDLSFVNSDELIAKIKAKINCSTNKTIYILSGGYEQFHTKFPFMCSNLDIRSATDRHKYLTIYPNCVIENQIFIGSGIQAKNWKIIRDLQITHILNCSIEHECVFQDEIKYLHVKIEDSYQENIYRVINKSLKFIEDAFQKYYDELMIYNDENAVDASSRNSSAASPCVPNKSSNVYLNYATKPPAKKTKPQRPVFLIHCNLGISRSSSILIAYLINKYKLCLYAAFNYVKDKRLQIAPNYSFLRQLKQFEEELY